jgi:ribosome-associated protein
MQASSSRLFELLRVSSSRVLGAPLRAYKTAVVVSGAQSVSVPRERLQTAFSRSSGPGGQNVNKLNTKAEVRFKLDEAEWMAPDVRERFREQYAAFINNEGEVYLSSQKHRSQESNRRRAGKALSHGAEGRCDPKSQAPAHCTLGALEDRVQGGQAQAQRAQGEAEGPHLRRRR